jgi:hypothetical protein
MTRMSPSTYRMLESYSEDRWCQEDGSYEISLDEQEEELIKEFPHHESVIKEFIDGWRREQGEPTKYAK